MESGAVGLLKHYLPSQVNEVMIDYFNMILSYRYDVERMIVDAGAHRQVLPGYTRSLSCNMPGAVCNLEGQHRRVSRRRRQTTLLPY